MFRALPSGWLSTIATGSFLTSVAALTSIVRADEKKADVPLFPTQVPRAPMCGLVRR